MRTTEHEWPQVTTGDHGWPRVTTSDHEWPEWPRVTTSDRSDHEWPRVTSEWPRSDHGVTTGEISSKCLSTVIMTSLKSDFHISSSNYNLLTKTEVIYCVNAQGMICNTFQEKIRSFLLTLKNLRLLFVLPTTAPPPPLSLFEMFKKLVVWTITWKCLAGEMSLSFAS